MKLKKVKPASIPLPAFLQSWMSRNAIAILLRSWLSQGFFYMIPIERGIKILQTGVLWSGFLLLVKALHYSLTPSVVISGLVITHSVNWLLSGQFWVVMTYLGYQTTPGEVRAYLHHLADQCRNTAFIRDALLYGSIARGMFKASSDIDVRILPGKGRLSLLKAALFTTFLRAQSFRKGIPLDIYLFENEEMLNRMNPDEKPVSLCQTSSETIRLW